VKNFSLSFRICLKGKGGKKSGVFFLESENFQNLKMIESKKFKNNKIIWVKNFQRNYLEMEKFFSKFSYFS